MTSAPAVDNLALRDRRRGERLSDSALDNLALTDRRCGERLSDSAATSRVQG